MGTPLDYRQTWMARGTDRVGIQLYREPADRHSAGPLIVVWPAMGVPADYYRPFASALCNHGLGVAVVDLRGTGASTPRPSRHSAYGYVELADDVGAVLDEVVPGSSDRPVVLMGHSLGGQACLMHLSGTRDERVKGLVLIAVALPYWRAYEGWMRPATWGFTQSIGAISALLGVWPGWGFGGRQARGVIRDWARTARTGQLPRRNDLDVTAALDQVKLPVLAVSVENDQYTPEPTVDYLCGLLGGVQISREHYTGSEAGERLDHFRWARTSGPLTDRIAAFVHEATTDG